DPEHLAQWAAAPANPFPTPMRVLAFIFAVAATIILLWWFGTGFIDIDARRALVALIILEGSFFLAVRRRIGAIVQEVGEPAHDLDLLSKIVQTLEAQHFQA